MIGIHHGSAGPIRLIVAFVAQLRFVQTAGSGQALLLGHRAVQEAAPGVFGAGEVQHANLLLSGFRKAQDRLHRRLVGDGTRGGLRQPRQPGACPHQLRPPFGGDQLAVLLRMLLRRGKIHPAPLIFIEPLPLNPQGILGNSFTLHYRSLLSIIIRHALRSAQSPADSAPAISPGSPRPGLIVPSRSPKCGPADWPRPECGFSSL
ncbi:hypothetical protein D1872_239530 [compost metagenome]